MSRPRIGRSADLKRLQDEGYEIEIRSGFLLVKNVPYVTRDRAVRRGVLVTSLELSGDVTSPPSDHVAHFVGDYPCGADGQEIAQIRNQSGRRALAEGLEVDHAFSAKPVSGQYADYYHKMTTYASILSAPAEMIDGTATPRSFAPVLCTEDESPVFKYADTASSRAEIVTVTQKLELESVAIVGLGGTGGYVLDLVAKTPVRAIHLFDGDLFLQHNAFRAPGAASLEELQARPSKVAYFAAIYSKMRHGIIPHDAYVAADNVALLDSMKFVFLCLEGGPAKKLIVERLEQSGVPFLDVGMGIQLADGALGGLVRVTTSTPHKRDHVRTRVSFAEDAAEQDYDRNIQVADLNALNAALAVIQWKKVFGFYRDSDHAHHSLYTIDGNFLTNAELLTDAQVHLA